MKVEGGLTLRGIPPDQLLDPVPGDVIVAGDLALGAIPAKAEGSDAVVIFEDWPGESEYVEI